MEGERGAAPPRPTPPLHPLPVPARARGALTVDYENKTIKIITML
jgi:hypothetical protein